jgi:hypothetical protein
MEINEAINEDNEGFTSSLQKPKKPRTEAQIEALKKAQIKRKENIEKRKTEKLQHQQINEDYEEVEEHNLDCNKVGVPNNLKEIFDRDPEYEAWLKQKALSYNQAPKPKPVIKRKPKKTVVVQEPDDSSSEEEIIYIPKKSKKKKKKKVIRHETSSEEEEEYYEPEPQQVYSQPNRQLRYSDVFQF